MAFDGLHGPVVGDDAVREHYLAPRHLKIDQGIGSLYFLHFWLLVLLNKVFDVHVSPAHSNVNFFAFFERQHNPFRPKPVDTVRLTQEADLQFVAESIQVLCERAVDTIEALRHVDFLPLKQLVVLSEQSYNPIL